ncbi:hypothetical protein GCM10009759_55600 [Kitasatospora saccharophila]|uniref:Uncharacterized protein n=1 Tax=Kitasatospora saccharophila TaxID=407973 RepID=A0ABN2XJE6_9ACTN
MTIKGIALIAAAGLADLAGTALLVADQVPVLAGALIGAATAGIPATILLNQRFARIDARAAEDAERRAQYDAAYATLGSQRERLMASLGRQLAQQRAELTARHRQELLQARTAEYLRGVRDTLGGALWGAEEQAPAEARVIDLAARRPEPSLVD